MFINDSKKSHSARFFLKPSGIIALRVTKKRKVKQYTTGLKWMHEYFSEEACFILPMPGHEHTYSETAFQLSDLLKKAKEALDASSSIEEFHHRFVEHTAGASAMRLSDAFEAMMLASKSKPQSQKAYRAWIAYPLKFDNADIAEIDESWVDAFTAWGDGQCIDKASMHCYHTVVRMTLNFARRKKWVNENAYAFAELQKGGKEKYALKEHELSALYDDWQKFDKGHKETARTFLFACLTGMRISDILDLRAEHIHAKHIAKISVKTGKPMRIPLSLKASSLLEHGLFFRKTSALNADLREIADVRELPQITTHCGRHTYATLLAKISKDPFILMKALGHSSIDMSLKYVGNNDEALAKHIDQLLP